MKTCIDCKWFASAIGVGQGLRCMHTERLSFKIPHSQYVCELHEPPESKHAQPKFETDDNRQESDNN